MKGDFSMKHYFLYAFTTILLSVISFTLCSRHVEGATQGNWNDSMYLKYNYSTFQAYGPANQEIDFKSIDYELLCASIFYATNKERVNATTSSPASGGTLLNLQPFEYSQYLKYSAQMHAYDMVANNFFDHNNPYDSTKKTPFDRMALCYITTGKRAENIADVFGIAYQSGSNFIPPNRGSPVIWEIIGVLGAFGGDEVELVKMPYVAMLQELTKSHESVCYSLYYRTSSISPL